MTNSHNLFDTIMVSRRETGEILPLAARTEERQDRLIPLVNIVFLLLAFFMIAGTIRAADTLAIEPPRAAGTGRLEPQNLTLYVSRDGALALEKRRVSINRALSDIKRWLARDPDGELEIKADRAVKAGVILPLLQRFSRAGIESVRLVAVHRAPARR